MNVAIIEDEKTESDRLIDYLQRYGREHSVKFNINVYKNGLDFMDGFKPVYDIVFMDIQMPVMDGMKTAEKLRTIDGECCLIFVTNIAAMAIRGYDYNAMFYLVKPLSYSVFAFKFDRVIAQIQKHKDDSIILNVIGSLIKLSMSSIYFVEVVRHDRIYHTAEGDFKVYGTLLDAEKDLPSESFVRCNACYLINLKYVTEITGDEVCVAGHKLKMSRSKKSAFQKALFDYMKERI